MSRSLVLLALSGAAIAQTTTADIILPGFDPGNIGASVVDVKSSLTTFSLACLDKTEECGILYDGLITQGESYWALASSVVDESASISQYASPVHKQLNPHLTLSSRRSINFQCDLDRKNGKASCSMHASQILEGETSELDDNSVMPNLSTYIQAIPVTAGADKLGGGGDSPSETTAAQTGASPTTSGSEPTATPTGETDGADDEEDAAASLKISAIGAVAAMVAVLALC
ncbi:hypothetical protein ACRE_012940 [Hapsidospora chrysogenum ATCC 11550]|uniref:Uncharacterized protein n=1 Tax=Hapsidospora chrysogenum (strain ATCC 11550 / CBS 779.69 / DSM 880 / IAM 14645 / JCM 23072 / IMI 49137) TaxID=857340 RepID=A0A086TEC8_HAPC1|nr:hypothetical protein ACRE_012940 [Hapsidospora chrysogenum ATCC 11550]